MHHNNLWLSIGSALGSLLSGFVAFATDYHLMWIVSLGAGIVSLHAGILTIKEKRMSIKAMEREEAEYKRKHREKTGGHV